MNSNIKTVKPASQFYARTGGLLYGVLILTGMFAVMFLRSKLFVSGDVIANANNIIQVLFLTF